MIADRPIVLYRGLGNLSLVEFISFYSFILWLSSSSFIIIPKLTLNILNNIISYFETCEHTLIELECLHVLEIGLLEPKCLLGVDTRWHSLGVYTPVFLFRKAATWMRNLSTVVFAFISSVDAVVGILM